MNDLSKPRATLLEVGEENAAQRIDNFLLRRLKGVPKSHVYRVLRSGQVRVNSARVRPDYRLRAGDRVRVPPVRTAERPAKPTPRPLELPTVYEDDDEAEAIWRDVVGVNPKRIIRMDEADNFWASGPTGPW